jgi:hypothetical protein
MVIMTNIHYQYVLSTFRSLWVRHLEVVSSGEKKRGEERRGEERKGDERR